MEQETDEDVFFRCTNETYFNCSVTQYLETMMGPQQLPLGFIVPITVVLCIIFLTGFAGNIATCAVIIRNSHMHNATNYYLFNLSISDLLLLVFGLPNEVLYFWKPYPYPLGIWSCKIRALISEGASYLSVLTIVAFTSERFIAICYPLLEPTVNVRLRRSVRVISLLWLISMSCALPFAYHSSIDYKEYPPLSNNELKESAFCGMLKAGTQLLLISSILFFFLPALVLICLYTKIALTIRETQGKNLTGTLRVLNGIKGSIHNHRRRDKTSKTIIRMLVSVVIAFFLCWTPFHFQRLFYIYGKEYEYFGPINDVLFYVSGPLYYVSATVNPILYNVMSHRYRKAFRETLCCGRLRRTRTKRSIYREHSSCGHHSETTQLVQFRDKKETNGSRISCRLSSQTNYNNLVQRLDHLSIDRSYGPKSECLSKDGEVESSL